MGSLQCVLPTHAHQLARVGDKLDADGVGKQAFVLRYEADRLADGEAITMEVFAHGTTRPFR